MVMTTEAGSCHLSQRVIKGEQAPRYAARIKSTGTMRLIKQWPSNMPHQIGWHMHQFRVHIVVPRFLLRVGAGQPCCPCCEHGQWHSRDS